MPGGAADKAGNRFEHLWVVLRISEMLEGKVSRIRPEPPGQAGVGIEMELDIDGVTWGEQVKDTAGNWTINKLVREGVLTAAKVQIDLGRSFCLVASSSADALETLADRARRAESFAEYGEFLGADRRTHLAQIAEAWQVSQEDAWLLLQKVKVEQVSANMLERHVANTLRRLYADDPDLIIGALRNFCEQHVHQAITPPKVSGFLESKGFKRQLIVGDSAVISQLRRTLERQQRRVERRKPRIGFVPRHDTDSVLEKLHNPDGGQIVVVDGRAGSGKSAVVAAVAASLREEGWLVAVARMDVDGAMTTSDQLGQGMDLPGSPSLLLAAAADGSPALLVVDQLDAVSTYSGRMPDSFEAVDEAVAEIGRIPNVKVLLVARTVDLEADPRMRSLLQSSDRFSRHTVGDLDIEDVKAQIAGHGMQVPTSEVTLELLCVPLHLSVFCHLSGSARNLEYTTLQELYDRYTDEVRTDVERRVGHLDWCLITNAMVRHMSDHEVLAAPAAALDLASPQEVSALASESVIVRDGNSVTFFHESYFDYLFARSFVTAGRDLRSFLLDSGQFLFRRAQTRQVLEHLAATDRPRFTEVVVELLTSDEVRPHLKDVVVRVLRETQATPEDWLALDELAWTGSRIGSKLVALLNTPGWFDATDSLGLWDGWLRNPERVKPAFYELTMVARERPARAAALVRPHIGESEDWRLRLRSMISWSLKDELVDLAVELVDLGHLDDATGPNAADSDIWWIIYSLNDDDPSDAARLIGALLRRGLARARENNSDDPFESGHLSRHSQSISLIADVAANAPGEFVDEVLPFVIEVATVGQRHGDEFLPEGQRWHYRSLSSDYTVDDVLFTATETALRKLAEENPARCARVLPTLCIAESAELRFLACRALVVMSDPDAAIDWLTSDPRNLVLGWSNSPSWASRVLIEECSPICSIDLFEKLESLILVHSPSWEGQGFRGLGQFELLSALHMTRMSDAAKRKLQELQRRFDNSEPQPPRPVVARTVGSPIGENAAAHMSDDDWLRALKKHSGDETNWAGDVPVGGARELARVLGSQAKDQPERFSALALRFDEEIPTAAMNAIVDNVEGALDVDVLADLCEHARDIYGEEVGRSLCSAIESAGTVNSRLVALLGVCARDADPDNESARTEAQGGGFFYGGDLLTAGLNSTRGQAALAMASILFSGRDHLDELLPAVETLVDDGLLAVRVCAAEAVSALLNHVPERALDLAERLFDAPIDVLDARTSEHLLRYSVLRDPDRFAEVFADALATSPEVATRAGRIWAIARWQGQLPTAVADDFRTLPTSARRGAAQVFAANVADSFDELPLVFEDDDPEVRGQAGPAMRHLDEIEAAALDELIAAFMASRAFPEQMTFLINAFERMSSRLPPITIDVCERVVDVADASLADASTAHAAMSRHLITVILRLYRQGDASSRARCLDLVDRLTELNVYDVGRALDDER